MEKKSHSRLRHANKCKASKIPARPACSIPLQIIYESLYSGRKILLNNEPVKWRTSTA
jgi:hypothetical protein